KSGGPYRYRTLPPSLTRPQSTANRTDGGRRESQRTGARREDHMRGPRSSSTDPERAFAMSNVVYLLFIAISQAVIPYCLDNYGLEGVYLSMAAYAILALPMYVLLLPPIKGEGSDADILKLIKDAPYRRLAVCAMAGVFIYELGQTAVFTYQDIVGDNVGIEAEDRGGLLGLAQFIGLLGGVLATWMGIRYGRFKPLLYGLGLNIIVSMALCINSDSDYYFYLMLVWDASYCFVMPYIMGTLASLDKMGRWAVAGDAFWNFAGTPAPYIATLIVTYGGFNPLAIWAFTSGAIGMALFCYAAKQSDSLGLEES
ncbi:MAG: hypothetical protein IH948_02455, partial [Bacteroidetes bacterium]|nr:hypothetical protein [Bacteroidota bacterium]